MQIHKFIDIFTKFVLNVDIWTVTFLVINPQFDDSNEGKMSHSRLFALATILTLVGSAPAYAYLDPGTGSMLLQGLIGGAVAAGSVISLYWHRLKAFFNGTKHDDEKDIEDK